MSTPRLISPLLDNFLMGEPIYDKCGVRLCPAMEEGKDDKYIVKIISIPANQSQVDALLITGGGIVYGVTGFELTSVDADKDKFAHKRICGNLER